MAGRRFSSSRGRRSNSFSRFRGRRRLRQPSAGKRWERANIFADTSLINQAGAATQTSVAILLARTANLADITTGDGRARVQQIRGIEIGGLVASWGMEPTMAISDIQDIFPGDRLAWSQGALVSDRLAVNGDPAAAVTANWNISQSPVVAASATQPSASSEEWDLPTQVHYRDTTMDIMTTVALESPVEGSLTAVHGQRVRMGRRALINKRLKLYLDDLHGLFFLFTSWTSGINSSPVPPAYRCWISGTLYYRVRY